LFAVPDDFVRTMIELNGAEGLAWLDRLPAILAACAQDWGLTTAPPFTPLSDNYVAPALCADGTPAVLKACFVPNREFTAEVEALRLYDGHGAVRLLKVDLEQGLLLLERCEPGTLLSAVEDDEETTSIAASIMRQLWRPVPPEHPFPTVGDWGRGFERLRSYFGGSGPFPAALVDEAERLFGELEASMAEPVVLHGDLHHFNILAAQREPWLAIDPKGLVGEPAYETGALLRNRLPEPLPSPEAGHVLARRVDQLSEELDLDRARLRGWGLAQAVLSAWWIVEDHGHGWEPAIACAELLAAIKV
jgi:streptomycin 6-kinase